MQRTALQMPAQMDMAACAHHSSTQHTTGQHCPHSQCCKGASCGCTQLPALMASLPSLVAAAPVTGPNSIRAQLSLASVPAKFLRPPI